MDTMASKQELKRNFLGILMNDTVKELTKETSDEGVAKKQSKNNGVGIKTENCVKRSIKSGMK